MKVVKMIMDALWNIQQRFIASDTGAFIYDKKWFFDENQKREDQYNSYTRGKHRTLMKGDVIRFYCELDGTNQMHLYETLLAHIGVFTRPFVRRMMEHRDVHGNPYVQYFSKTYDPHMLYLVFKMPSSKPVVLCTLLKNMFNTKYEPHELPYADDSLFSGGYPTLPIITRDKLINRDQMQILDNFGDEIWKLRSPNGELANSVLINLERSNDINEEVYGKDLRPCDTKGDNEQSLIELLDSKTYGRDSNKELAFQTFLWDELEEPTEEEEHELSIPKEMSHKGRCKTCGVDLMDENATDSQCSKCDHEKWEELENV